MIKKAISLLIIGVLISLTFVQAFHNARPNEFQIVVGERAAASDTLAAIELAEELGDFPDNVDSNIGRFIREDIPLGLSITSSGQISQELDDSELEGLLDEQISFQGDTFDVSEVIILSQAGRDVSVETSLTSNEEDYEKDVYLEIDRSSINYYFNFEDPIDLSQTTTTESLDINFLGRPIRIVDIVDADTFTALIGDRKLLRVDDTLIEEGKNIRLVNVGSGGAIVVEIDGQAEVIQEGTSQLIDGLSIFNEETFYEDRREERFAVVVIGTDSLETITDGDGYIGEDEDDPDWVWNIGNLLTVSSSNPSASNDGTGPFIGLTNDFVLDDFNDNPPKIGESIVLPNDYLEIRLDRLNQVEYADYNLIFEDSTDLSDALGDGFTSENTIHIETSVDDGLIVVPGSLSIANITGSAKTEDIWLFVMSNNNLGVFYLEDNDVKLAGEISTSTQIKFAETDHGDTKDSDMEFYATYTAGDQVQIRVRSDEEGIDLNDDLVATFDIEGSTIDSLGNELNTEEATELTWNGTNIGTNKHDLLTRYGVIVLNPDQNSADDEIRLQIPDDQVQADVVISKLEPGVNTNLSNDTTDINNDRRVNGLITLDVDELVVDNVVFVGGPRANDRTKQYIPDWQYVSGQAIIKRVTEGNREILIIAGTDASDTRSAVQKYLDDPNILGTGTEIVINV